MTPSRRGLILIKPDWLCYRVVKKLWRIISYYMIATLTFDLVGHGACGWCGSSSFIRIPSLKFVRLAIRMIYRTMCVSINGRGDLDVWPVDLETGTRVASEVGNLYSEVGHARPSGSPVIRYVRDGRTDGWTKATFNANGREHNKRVNYTGCSLFCFNQK